ncbi:hypothetical protein D3C81_2104760 [compost metagenome]
MQPQLAGEHGLAQVGEGIGEPGRLGVGEALFGQQAFAQCAPLFDVGMGRPGR